MEYHEEDDGEFVLPHQPFGLWNPTVQMFGVGNMSVQEPQRTFLDGKSCRTMAHDRGVQERPGRRGGHCDVPPGEARDQLV